MVSTDAFRRLALSFPGTEENPHFDRAAFKVAGRRIFATLHEPSKTVNIMLSRKEQSVFCQSDKEAIFPVPNKWGDHGATTFMLRQVAEEVLAEALRSAYDEVVNSRPAKKGRRAR